MAARSFELRSDALGYSSEGWGFTSEGNLQPADRSAMVTQKWLPSYMTSYHDKCSIVIDQCQVLIMFYNPSITTYASTFNFHCSTNNRPNWYSNSTIKMLSVAPFWGAISKHFEDFGLRIGFGLFVCDVYARFKPILGK